MVSRNVELVRLIQNAIPTPLIPVFVFITYLGSAPVFLATLVLYYWMDDGNRTDSAFALAMALCASGLTLVLKDTFALPRPPSAFHLISIGGYGFPSGHATQSTIVYGTLALVLTISTRRRRAVGAALLVGLISLSRVVLGVHYVSDVVAGIIVGTAFLAGAVWITDRDPLRAFWLAAFIAVLGLLVSSSSRSGMLLGTSTGGAVLWWWIGPSSTMRFQKPLVAGALVGLVILSVVVMLVSSLNPPVVVIASVTLVFCGALALPAAAAHFLTLRTD